MRQAIWSVCITLAVVRSLLGQESKIWRTLTDHTGQITSVTISPDSKTVASGSADRTIKLWDVTTGKIKLTFKGHGSPVTSLAFSSDGRMLASGSQANVIRLWDVASGKSTATLLRHSAGIMALAFSPDGSTLASGSDDGTVKLWDIASKTYTATVNWHRWSVFSVTFGLDGKLLASGSDDGTIKLWDVATHKNLATLKGYKVVVSPDGKTLASGGADGTIQLWDLAGGKTIATLARHRRTAHVLGFARGSAILASWSPDNKIKLWDVASGKCMTTITRHFVPWPCVSLSADGKILAASSREQVLLWDLTKAPAKDSGTVPEDHDLEATCFLEEDHDLVEQAFRHLISSKELAPEKAFFLSLKPSSDIQIDDDFIKRFKDLKVTVKKESAWKEGAGAVLSVELVKWVSNTEVELSLSSYWGSLAAYGYTCRFEFKDAKWRFKKGSKKNEWVA